jgi:hypothetical protein
MSDWQHLVEDCHPEYWSSCNLKTSRSQANLMVISVHSATPQGCEDTMDTTANWDQWKTKGFPIRRNSNVASILETDSTLDHSNSY